MSPIGRFFKGKGEQVLSDMQDRYGPDKGKSVFYATANKNPEMKPPEDRAPKKRKTVGSRLAALAKQQ